MTADEKKLSLYALDRANFITVIAGMIRAILPDDNHGNKKISMCYGLDDGPLVMDLICPLQCRIPGVRLSTTRHYCDPDRRVLIVEWVGEQATEGK